MDLKTKWWWPGERDTTKDCDAERVGRNGDTHACFLHTDEHEQRRKTEGIVTSRVPEHRCPCGTVWL